MRGAIVIEGMRAYGKHGVDEAERAEVQPLLVDLTLELDLEAAAHDDRLESTVDYAEIHERVLAIVETTSFALLERLCAEVLENVMRDERIEAAEVCISKPGLLRGATPAVRLRRERER